MRPLKSHVPLELLEELEERFKPKRPLPNQTMAEIFLHSGEVAVVEFLRTSYEEQQQIFRDVTYDLFPAK